MRLARRNLVLAACLALLVAGNLVVGGGGAPAATVSALFPRFTPDQARRIRMQTGDGVLELERTDQDEPGGEARWTVPQAADFAAHGGAVQALLRAVAGLSSVDLVSKDAASHADLGVADDGSRMTVQDAAGGTVVDLIVGPAADGARGTHVRVPGATAVHRSAALAPLDVDPARWLDTHLFSFDPTRVRRVRLAGGGETASEIELRRRDDGRWVVSGDPQQGAVPPALLDPLLLAAANLFFLEVVAAETLPEHGLGEAAGGLELTIEVESPDATGGPRVSTLRLGAPAEGGRLATVPGWERPWVVLLPESSARRIEAGIARLREALR